MADGDGGNGALGQATANLILQQLAKIAAGLATGATLSSTATSAGAASGLYLQVSVSGTIYKIALLNA